MLAFNRALLVTAAASLAAATAQAQTVSLGSPVSATGSYAGDSLDRAATYTQSAYTAPKGRYGFTVQGQAGSVSSEGVDVSASGAAFSAFYGITDGITVGAGLPYMSLSMDTPVGEAKTDGMADVELFGRMRAFRSSTGATRVAVGAGVTLPTGDDAFTADDPTYQIGAAMSHRMNRISFHVAPDVRLVKDVDMSYDLNLAAAFAATPKLALSAELLNAFEGYQSDANIDRTRFTDVGAGLRYSGIQNLVLDLGLRTNVSTSVEGADYSDTRATFGFSWLF